MFGWWAEWLGLNGYELESGWLDKAEKTKRPLGFPSGLGEDLDVGVIYVSDSRCR